MNDFRKYATQHLGINGMVLDEVTSMQNQYLNPYILEERQLNVTQMDVFSRLMMDRIIFLGTQIDDYTGTAALFRLGRPWERHFHLHQLAWWKRNGRTWHLRYHAVYLQRRSYHLHWHGSFYGSRLACSGSGGQAFGIAA